MALPVFKTGEAEHLGLAGSIPVRLRHPLPRTHPCPSGCAEEAEGMAVPLTEFALTLLLALVVTLLVVVVTHVVAVLASRRWPVAGALSRYVAMPFRLVGLVLVVAWF